MEYTGGEWSIYPHNVGGGTSYELTSVEEPVGAPSGYHIHFDTSGFSDNELNDHYMIVSSTGTVYQIEDCENYSTGGNTYCGLKIYSGSPMGAGVVVSITKPATHPENYDPRDFIFGASFDGLSIIDEPEPYCCAIRITKAGTAGQIYERDDAPAYMQARSLSWAENHPAKISATLSNSHLDSAYDFMRSTCAIWSGSVTGAIAQGDKLEFVLITLARDTSMEGIVVLATGEITDVMPNQDGSVTVQAFDRSARLDLPKPHKTIYPRHIVHVCSDELDTYSKRRIIFKPGLVNTSTPILPMEKVEFSDTDVEVDINDDDTNFTMLEDHIYGQVIIPDGHLLGVTATIRLDNSINDDGEDVTVTCRVYPLNPETNLPEGELRSYYDTQHIDAHDSAEKTFELDLTTAGGSPLFLKQDVRYIIAFEATTFDVANTLVRLLIDPTPTYRVVATVEYDGAAWTAADTVGISMKAYFAQYTTISNDSLIYDINSGSDSYVYLIGDVIDTTTASADLPWETYRRARLHYHYYDAVGGTVERQTLADVCTALIKCNTALKHSVSADLTRNVDIYTTRGKSIGECMRECLDLYSGSGATARQAVMQHYVDGSDEDVLKVCERLNAVQDAAYLTLARGDEAVTDVETLIVGTPNLKKTNTKRYIGVRVTGKDSAGHPIVATRYDRTQIATTLGVGEVYVHNDDGIRTPSDAAYLATSMLDRINRNTYEGTIRISGLQIPWDYDTASGYFGSGKIVQVTIPEAGIWTTAFKVTSAEIGLDYVDIYVNNKDILVDNYLTRTYGSAQKSESFLSPLGTPTDIYLHTHSDTFIDDDGNDAYMVLQDSDGNTILDSKPVLCTKYTSSDYDENTYYAELDATNGYTHTEDDRVAKVRLQESDGTEIYTHELVRTTAANVDIDEQCDKPEGARLIVELSCPSS
jgi:hypothetical protein